jgi:DNA repair exonuclease SbcCD nuclease subunit/DNA repair exonuclease SbcCD ATPase subunit
LNKLNQTGEKTMKIFCTADWHIDNNKDFFKSLDFFVKCVEEQKPDLVTIAGDLFDKAQLNTDSSGFVEVQSYMLRILNVCPVMAIYGTPSHDVAGSLSVFEKMRGKNSFIILDPGVWYSVGSVLVTGIPEINKSFMLSENDDSSIDDLLEKLKKFFDGLAISKRKGFNSLVLFHGSIAGSKLTENQVLPGGGLSLPVSYLEGIGADYVSCGHIHMRQEVAPNVWYEGSIYPKTWGERTTKAFTCLDIYDDSIERSEIKFPVQPMEKIKVSDISEVSYYKDTLPKNVRLWVEIEESEKDFKDMRESDFESDKKYLKSFGFNLDDCRITYTVKKDETTRAAEIVETTSLADKFMIWLKNTTSDVAESVKHSIVKLCSGYEEKLKKLGLLHQRRELELISLSLRGAIGIKKGTGKEDINIDFTKYSHGIIALLGDNGSGKSTIIKNCNPYPDAMDGGVGLKNMFFLKDSHSITVWRDAASGIKYKCIKKINGVTGKSEYYLMKGILDWEPYNADQNGRKEPYRKAVLDIFGSDEIFKRSVYIAQKGSSLPQTVSERKKLFNELLGNQYLEEIHKMVKEDQATKEAELKDLTGKIDVLQGASINEKEVKDYIWGEKKRLEKMIGEMPNHKAIEQDHLKDLADVRKDLEELNKEEVIYEQITKEIHEMNAKVTSNKKTIQSLKYVLINEPSLLAQVNKHTRAKDDADKLKTNIDNLSKNRDKKENEYNEYLKDYQKKYDGVNDDICQLEKFDIQNKKAYIETYRNVIKTRQEWIDNISTPCPQCGYLSNDIQDKIKLFSEEIQMAKEKTAKSLLELEKLQDDLKAKNKLMEAISISHKLSIEEYELPIQDDESEIKILKEKLEEVQKSIMPDDEYQDVKEKLLNVKFAGKEIEKLSDEIKEINSKLSQKLHDQSLLMISLKRKGHVLEKIEFLEGNLNSTRELIIALEKDMSVCETGISRAEEDLIKNADNLKKLNDMIHQSNDLVSELSVLNLLRTGTGKDGIQALELDALTPAILTTANKLLTSIYGDKFSLSVSTTKETTKGEQVEDFEIMVTDNEEENYQIKEQKLNTLSGGEEVWILKAVYDAFAIVGEKNTGLKFLTTFQDEADGALSPEKKHLYLRMIEASHKETGRSHTVYVTHDQLIQQLIKERIELGFYNSCPWL